MLSMEAERNYIFNYFEIVWVLARLMDFISKTEKTVNEHSSQRLPRSFMLKGKLEREAGMCTHTHTHIGERKKEDDIWMEEGDISKCLLILVWISLKTIYTCWIMKMFDSVCYMKWFKWKVGSSSMVVRLSPWQTLLEKRLQ